MRSVKIVTLSVMPVTAMAHMFGNRSARDSTEKDALLLLEKIMDLPSVHMHGPEHHAIVPCVLLTAFRNNGEHMDYDAALSEICKERSRFRAVPVVTGVSVELLPEPVFSCPL